LSFSSIVLISFVLFSVVLELDDDSLSVYLRFFFFFLLFSPGRKDELCQSAFPFKEVPTVRSHLLLLVGNSYKVFVQRRKVKKVKKDPAIFFHLARGKI